jgi:hypothetical protein
MLHPPEPPSTRLVCTRCRWSGYDDDIDLGKLPDEVLALAEHAMQTVTWAQLPCPQCGQTGGVEIDHEWYATDEDPAPAAGEDDEW